MKNIVILRLKLCVMITRIAFYLIFYPLSIIPLILLYVIAFPLYILLIFSSERIIFITP